MLVFAFGSTTVKRLHRPKQLYLTCTTWKSTSVSNERKGGEAGEEGEEEQEEEEEGGNGGRKDCKSNTPGWRHTQKDKEVRKWGQKEAKRNVENPWQQTWVDPFRPQPCCNYLAQWVWALGMDPKGLGLDPSLWAISLTVFPSLPWPFSLPQATVFRFFFWPLRLFTYKMGKTIFF